MPIQNEKIIVFKDGNPTELRYYEAEKLVARLGTILDTDGNFIGLRELDVEEVSPSSWFERNIFKKQPQKHVDILTVDFIGLINWINTIKTIKNIENIESIDLIDSITSITEILEIDRIKNIESAWISTNPIRNPNFLSGFDGWLRQDTTNITLEDEASFGKMVKFNSAAGFLYQFLATNNDVFDTLTFWAYKPAVGGADILLRFMYTDGTFDQYMPTLTNTMALYSYTPDSGKKLYAVRFTDNTGICYLSFPQLIKGNTVTVSSLPTLVASNVALGLGESATYGTIRVDTATSGQATLLAAQGAGLKIYVCGYQLQAQGDVMVSLRSAAVDISSEWDLNAREGVVCPVVPKPLSYCNTVANELLSINLDAAIRVTGNIQYWLGA